jgi:dienelactone hydrolase
MATIVLFHSVLGIRAGVSDAADRFRAAGHTVHLPDLFDGKTFDDYEPAMAHVESLGGGQEMYRRAHASVSDIPTDVCYAGFSLGGGSALHLAATRPGARGALAFHESLPLRWLDAPAWPSSVPLQVHFAELDPFREQESIDELRDSVLAAGASYEFFDYQGISGHLFTDASLPAEYDEPAATLMFERAMEFLDRCGG